MWLGSIFSGNVFGTVSVLTADGGPPTAALQKQQAVGASACKGMEFTLEGMRAASADTGAVPLTLLFRCAAARPRRLSCPHLRMHILFHAPNSACTPVEDPLKVAPVLET